MSSIALLGAGGMLGQDIARVFPSDTLTSFTRGDLDITDAEAVGQSLEGFDFVINAAAYTKVDQAETERDEAFAINSLGPKNVAEACRELGQKLIHVSTDYVFDGRATTPYSEDHSLNPQSVYGQSKAEGERHVLAAHPENTIIVRTAWLYGSGGPNFVTTMLRLAATNDTVSVVTDQVGQPTWSSDLAQMIKTLADSPVSRGNFHGTNAGHASWWDFARAIFAAAGLDENRVLQATSEQFVRPAPRPAWSVLGHDNWEKNALPSPRPWEVAFAEAWTTVSRSHPSEKPLP